MSINPQHYLHKALTFVKNSLNQTFRAAHTKSKKYIYWSLFE